MKLLAIDRDLNQIEMENSIIYLKLKSENRKRRIAVVRMEEKELFITRNYEKHRHRKSDSYGINHWLLQNAEHCTHISLRDNYNLYKIPISFWLSQGEYMQFKKESQEVAFEKQLFVKIPELLPFIVNA